MIDLDAVLSNADWAKRTPDTLQGMEKALAKTPGDNDEAVPEKPENNAYGYGKPKKPRRRKRGG